MRILIVNTGYYPVPPISSGPFIGGSIELHTYYLANELARLNNEVHYITNINQNASFNNNVILHQIPKLSLAYRKSYVETLLNFAIGGFLSFKEVGNVIKEYKYDIIHAHGSISGTLILPFVKSNKYVFTIHNRTPWMLKSSLSIRQAFQKVAYKVLDYNIINHADYLIAVSDNIKKEIINRFNIDHKKIKVISNGVDNEYFKPEILNSKNIIDKYGIKKNFILFVGRLVEEKGVHFILKAMVGTKLHLVIVGDGPLFSYLKNLSVILGIDRQVHFTSSVLRTDVAKFFAEAQFFVLPSIAEGLPLTGLEAMASGLPIIASHNSGMEDIIKQGNNGIIVDPENTLQFRKRLIMLSEDDALRKKMGKNSRKIVEEKYSWGHMAKKIFDLYENMM